MEGKFGNTGLYKSKEVAEKSLYISPETTLVLGTEGEINLMARDNNRAVNSYWVYLTFDSSILKVTGLMVNKEVFEVVEESSVNQNLGLIILKVKTNKIKLSVGDQKLATIKVEGLKKGTAVMSNSRKSEVTTILDGNQINDNFQFVTFRLGIK